MCVPACQEKIASMNRRSFLKSAGAASVAAVTSPNLAQMMGESHGRKQTIRFNQVVDLTHTLFEEFPTYFGAQQLFVDEIFTQANDGFNLNEWRVNEHTGTHMDAPFHFSDQDTADQIPVENLIGQLAIIDIRSKAEDNSDAQVTPDDLRTYEQKYGRIRKGSIVAMNSGWDQYVNSEKFRNADGDGVMHFPGFHIEAVEWLLEKRDVKGIMVDTLSLDFGPSADFAVHFRWLPANKWGIENVANLSSLPPKGATVMVGGPKIAGATGGPSRVIALHGRRFHNGKWK